VEETVALTLDQHTKHVIVTVLVVLGLGLVAWGTFDLIDKYNQRRAQIDHEKIEADKVTNKANEQASTQANLQLQQIVSQQQAQTRALAQSLAQLQTQLKNQQQKDANATQPELIDRWSLLAQIPKSELQITNDNHVLASLVAVRETVVKLDEIPVLEETVKQQSSLIQKDQSAINQCQVTVSSYQNQITGLNKTIVDSDKACKDEIALVKSTARKHNVIYTIVSFLAGIAFGKKF
jgi:uncharacterized protein HemX